MPSVMNDNSATDEGVSFAVLYPYDIAKNSSTIKPKKNFFYKYVAGASNKKKKILKINLCRIIKY